MTQNFVEVANFAFWCVYLVLMWIHCSWHVIEMSGNPNRGIQRNTNPRAGPADVPEQVWNSCWIDTLKSRNKGWISTVVNLRSELTSFLTATDKSVFAQRTDCGCETMIWSTLADHFLLHWSPHLFTILTRVANELLRNFVSSDTGADVF